MSDVDGAAVVFKKRAVKSNNARKREMPIKEEEDTEETGSNPTLTLSDIKLQQTIRQRKTGLSIDALSKASKNTASSGVDEVGVKTIGSVMGKQYTTEIDYGIQANIPHKKLMDQYIDEKLGLSKSERYAACRPAFALIVPTVTVTLFLFQGLVTKSGNTRRPAL